MGETTVVKLAKNYPGRLLLPPLGLIPTVLKHTQPKRRPPPKKKFFFWFRRSVGETLDEERTNTHTRPGGLTNSKKE